MGATPNDLAWRVNKNKTLVVVTSPTEYVANTVTRLFHMHRGSDDFNRDMGLDIITHAKRKYSPNSRDIEYENEVTRQLTEYTDIEVDNAVAVYRNGMLIVGLEVRYENVSYNISMTSEPESLAKIITSQ